MTLNRRAVLLACTAALAAASATAQTADWPALLALGTLELGHSEAEALVNHLIVNNAAQMRPGQAGCAASAGDAHSEWMAADELISSNP